MADAPVPAALLGAQIRPVFSLLAPCGTGASAISVRHSIYARDHLVTASVEPEKEDKETDYFYSVGDFFYF
jgi:hypothetical protein